jgi:hypothetical protein
MSNADERGASASAMKIPAGDVTLAADAFGDPADPPVVLLHRIWHRGPASPPVIKCLLEPVVGVGLLIEPGHLAVA